MPTEHEQQNIRIVQDLLILFGIVAIFGLTMAIVMNVVGNRQDREAKQRSR